VKENFLKFKKLIEKAENVLIVAHKRPDGDTLGATCAMYYALQNMKKKVTMACIDDPSPRFHFLPDIKKMVKEFDFREFNLIIVMDAGASYMTKYHEIYPEMFGGDVPMINIDHHASNDNFGMLNIVDSQSASTTVILYKIFESVGIKITPNMATALLTGIYNDTGSLQHSNTNLEVFEISGRLVELGGKVQMVSQYLFKKTPLSTMKLWGRALENARVNDEGVTVSVLTWKDFIDCGAEQDEVSGVVDMMNSIPGAKYVCLLNEDRHGNVKGSFRTQRGNVDLEVLASKFGGGGHKKAAGFTMPGRIHQETHWKIIPAQELVSESMLPKLV
jgi:bifunctional oligoribonuclease and PAP phosphatase NrnA